MRTGLQRNMASIVALCSLLQDVLRNPALYSSNVLLKTSLQSQGALARYSDASKGIFASSINSLKRHAIKVDGGFAALDDLRKRALNGLTELAQAAQIQPITKAGLLRQSDKQHRLEIILREDLDLLTFLLKRALSQGRAYAAKADPSVASLCQREQREIHDMLSLKKTITKEKEMDHNNVESPSL